MKHFPALLLAAVGAGAGALPAAQPACAQRTAAAPAVERLRAALLQGRFVAYQPTSLAVVDGHITPATADSIREDLAVLRRSFDSLITYDAIHGAESIAPIAAELQYRALIVGVWNPFDAAELDAAVAAAQRFPQLVAGVALGNELLFAKRTDVTTLGATIARLRSRLPHTPLATAEPFHLYYQAPAQQLLGELDFLLVNVHPIFQPWFRDAADGVAAQFVVNVAGELARRYCGPILVKETGEPSAPGSAGFTEARQATFYAELRRRFPPTRARAFAYFAAFDAPWRAFDAIAVPDAPPAVHPEEAHWGLFDASRRGKLAARQLPPLTSPPSPP